MTSHEERTIPDVADGHRRLIALAVLALGTKYAVSAGSSFVDPGLAVSLALLEDGLALLAVAFVVPVLLWKVRNRSRDDWHLYRDDDGFVAQTIVRAQTGSWTLTFLVLILVATLDRTLAGLSKGFVVSLVLAVMLLSFSIIFLYLDRESDEGLGEDGDA